MQIVLYIISCIYSINIYYGAGKLYLQSFYVVPKGDCRMIVKIMAWTFFISWFTYPILFIMGPEGMGRLSMRASIIAHCFGDLLAKNLWGYLGHVLRIKVGKFQGKAH
jgi:bacteriorhodopsin